MEASTQNPQLAAKQTERGLGWSSWIEVDLTNLEANLEILERISSVPILPVLKGDAYGHGAPVVAAFFKSKNYKLVAVSSLEEALAILDLVKIKILMLTPPLPDQIPTIFKKNIVPTVTSASLITQLAKAAYSAGKKIEVHLKIDTGFGRLGADPKDALQLISLIKNTPYLKLGGIFTHFSQAYHNRKFTTLQLKRLLQVRKELQAVDATSCLWHAANSAAFLTLPASKLDLVRLGTILYGQSGSDIDEDWQLKQTWLCKSRILQIRTLPKGHSIGYGREYITKRPTKVGVIALGYSHGFELEPIPAPLRQLRQVVLRVMHQNPPCVFYRGKALPVLGRIGMGLCCIDLSPIPKIEIGEAVIVPMRRVTAATQLPHIYLVQGKEKCVLWNNKVYVKGQWLSRLEGLF